MSGGESIRGATGTYYDVVRLKFVRLALQPLGAQPLPIYECSVRALDVLDEDLGGRRLESVTLHGHNIIDSPYCSLPKLPHVVG